MTRPVAIMLVLLLASAAVAQPAGKDPAGAVEGKRMIGEARGHFEVDLKPDGTVGDGIGRYALTKTFHGDLEASSVGEMLGARTATPGSAGYVLIEQVAGRLNGRSGAFTLQHHGIMNRGRPDLSVTVIPDSGTGALAGLAGSMTIDAANNHAYVFTYTLPDAP
jgi:hypothetical protein